MFLRKVVPANSEDEVGGFRRAGDTEDRAGEEDAVGLGRGESLDLAGRGGEDGGGVDEDGGVAAAAGEDAVAFALLVLGARVISIGACKAGKKERGTVM